MAPRRNKASKPAQPVEQKADDAQPVVVAAVAQSVPPAEPETQEVTISVSAPAEGKPVTLNALVTIKSKVLPDKTRASVTFTIGSSLAVKDLLAVVMSQWGELRLADGSDIDTFIAPAKKWFDENGKALIVVDGSVKNSALEYTITFTGEVLGGSTFVRYGFSNQDFTLKVSNQTFLDFASILPAPGRIAASECVWKRPAAYDHLEMSRTVHPFARPHPDAPFAARWHRNSRDRVRNRKTEPVCDQVGRAHHVHELDVQLPPARVKRLRMNGDSRAGHRQRARKNHSQQHAFLHRLSSSLL